MLHKSFLHYTFAGLFFGLSANAMATTHNLARHTTMLNLEMPKENRQIWRGGNWQYNGMSGFIQVIYKPHPYSAKGETQAQAMQLQWVRTDHGQVESVYMVSVNEVNHVANFQFEAPICVESSGCNTFTVAVKSSYENRSVPFMLTIGGLGQYSLAPAFSSKSSNTATLQAGL